MSSIVQFGFDGALVLGGGESVLITSIALAKRNGPDAGRKLISAQFGVNRPTASKSHAFTSANVR